jgi:hypothetical protein
MKLEHQNTSNAHHGCGDDGAGDDSDKGLSQSSAERSKSLHQAVSISKLGFLCPEPLFECYDSELTFVVLL